MDSWEFYQDNAGKWRWRRTASNGRIVGASTEGYRNRSDCMANAERNGHGGDDWEFYRDKAGKWRWRRKARNGEIVGASSEGYANRTDCVENARRNGHTGTA